MYSMVADPLTDSPHFDGVNPQGRGFRRLAFKCFGAGLGLAALLAWLKVAWSSVALQHFVYRAEPYAGVALIAAGALGAWVSKGTIRVGS